MRWSAVAAGVVLRSRGSRRESQTATKSMRQGNPEYGAGRISARLVNILKDH